MSKAYSVALATYLSSKSKVSIGMAAEIFSFIPGTLNRRNMRSLSTTHRKRWKAQWVSTLKT